MTTVLSYTQLEILRLPFFFLSIFFLTKRSSTRGTRAYMMQYIFLPLQFSQAEVRKCKPLILLDITLVLLNTLHHTEALLCHPLDMLPGSLSCRILVPLFTLACFYLITVADKDRGSEDMCQLSQSRGLLPSHRADTRWRGIWGRCVTCGWVTWRPASPVLSRARRPGVCSTTRVRLAGQRLCSPQGLLSEFESMLRWGCTVLWCLLRIW